MSFRFIDTIGRIYSWVMKILIGTATAVLAPMMFLIAGDVIGRYLFKLPIPAVFDINSKFLMVLVVFFPLANVHRRKGHISVDIFTRKFPLRARTALDILSLVLGIITFGLIGWYGLDVALIATRVKDYAPGIIDVPIWLSKWIVPIGAFAFCIELLIDGAKHMEVLIKGTPE